MVIDVEPEETSTETKEEFQKQKNGVVKYPVVTSFVYYGAGDAVIDYSDL